MTPASNQDVESIINVYERFRKNVTEYKLSEKNLTINSSLDQLKKLVNVYFRFCREHDEAIQVLEELNIDKKQIEEYFIYL